MVYRGMDIGTAKPDAATLAEFPHALIDIREPHEGYSVAAFVADACRRIEAAFAAARVPILVGLIPPLEIALNKSYQCFDVFLIVV